MYFRSIINAYSLISHEWWVPLIKFMVGPTIHVRVRVHIYGTPEVPNNFPQLRCSGKTQKGKNNFN